MSPPNNNPVMAEQLEEILGELRDLKTALLGSTALGAPPGLIVRVAEAERNGADLRRQVEQLAAEVRDLKAVPGKTAITWWDRLGLALLGVTLSALAAMIGASLKGGPH